MKRRFPTILFALSVITLCPWPAAVDLRTQGAGQSDKFGANSAGQQLSKEEETLALESKQAILSAGISRAYFAKHFQLIKVVNLPGDRRVVWRFRVNEYETTVDDSIGYYTVADKRVNIHSVTNLLRPAHEVTRTIPRARARRLMRACIGEFEGESVSYQGNAGGLALFLTAQSKVSRESREKERKSEQAGKNRERDRSARNQISPNEIQRERDDVRTPTILGSINLETGKCMKGQLLISP
jgi:hypothetical protein